MPQNLPSLDTEVIASLRSLEEDAESGFLKSLISAFLDDTPNRLAEIHKAIESGESKALERAAHALKGSSGNMGAQRLSECMNQLVGKARAKKWEGVETLSQEAENEYTVVKGLLLAEGI